MILRQTFFINFLSIKILLEICAPRFFYCRIKERKKDMCRLKLRAMVGLSIIWQHGKWLMSWQIDVGKTLKVIYCQLVITVKIY